MRLKMTNLAVLILFISLITITGAGAQGAAITGYPLFFLTTTSIAPSYLTGNNDFNSGQQENLYLQPASATEKVQPVTTVNNQQPASATEKVQPVTTANNQQPASATQQVQPGFEDHQSATSVLSKIPSWLLMGCFIIDIIISVLLLGLVMMKKI